MLDIHVHILPEVDDGARSHRQALQMLRAAQASGIDTLVATPHLKQLKEDLTHIDNAFCWLQPHAKAVGIRLLKGYEVYYKALLDLPCSQNGRYCISGTNLLLLELDDIHLFPQWNLVLEGLVRSGYRPIIAHPERYVYIQEHPEIIGKMRRIGCKIQSDAQAFLKPLWNTERRTAKKILYNGWMDYIASDAHRPGDYEQFQQALRRLQGHLPTECLSPESIYPLPFSL